MTAKWHQPPSIAGRVPPHDLDAEAAVLSASMLDRDALDRVATILEPKHFYSEANGIIYDAIHGLAVESKPVDVVSVAAVLRKSEKIARVGGVQYLAQIVDATPAIAHVVAHAEVVLEKYRIRLLISTCQRYAAEAYGNYGDGQEFVDGAEQALYEISRTTEPEGANDIRSALTIAFDKIKRAAESGGGITGISSGYRDLDEVTAGLHEGDLMIVAARPGMGKTSLALNIAAHVAKAGAGVAIFSLEMPRDQVAVRMACCEARADVGGLRKGTLTAGEWSALTASAGTLAALPIWIEDACGLTLLKIRSKLRRIQADNRRDGADQGIGLVVIDYLQLMSGKGQNRESEISGISRGLKEIAKEFRVPVIALSQLNRGVETRAGKYGKRPLLSDLRESGAIEQDADTIVFLYREDYYDAKAESPGICELIVAKQRNGPTATIGVRFIHRCTRFDDLTNSEREEFSEWSR